MNTLQLKQNGGKNIFLIDGYGFVFRAYYAFIKNPLINSKGINTQAIYGFFRMLINLIKKFDIDYIIVAFDTKEKTFRHKRYEKYKAHRLKAPEEIHIQVDIVKQILQKADIKTIEAPGHEADDIIGTVAKKYSNTHNIYIVSSDKDILQLMNKNTKVISPKKGVSDMVLIDENYVKDKWGIWPYQMVDFIALAGDTSDNIPGVKGIGKVSATKLLNEYDNLNNIYKNIDKIKPESLKKKLIEGKESAYLSRELAQIVTNVDIILDIRDCKNTNIFNADVANMFYELELNSLLTEEDFKNINIKTKKEPQKGKYYIIDNKNKLYEIITQIKQKNIISIDTESTGKDPMKANIIGISISIKEGEGFYIPLRHNIAKQIDIKDAKTSLKEILANKNIKKVGHNIKYDYLLLKREGFELKGIYFDTMVASYLLNPSRNSHSLDFIAKEFLNYNTIKYKDIVKEKKATLLDSEINEVVDYAGEDADITLRLYNILSKALKHEIPKELFYNIEMPLVKILADMQYRGIKIDRQYFNELSNEFGNKLRELENTIYKEVGESFLITSPKQLQHILFEVKGFKPIKKGKTGYSTDNEVLMQLKREYPEDPLPSLIIKYRFYQKLKSTYTDTLPKLADKNSRIHSSFNQTITATGRLSSTNPNLQNIPIREEAGKKVRGGFIPEDGYIFISADYSQIELRVLAHFSKDENLINAFRKGIDIHYQTASIIFGKKDISDKERSIAKSVNFGVLYGLSPYGLAQDLMQAGIDISQSEAKLFIDSYFANYPTVKSFIEKHIDKVKTTGYTKTLLGRKRQIPEINSRNKTLEKLGRRLAINTLIQGSAADIIKKAMVAIERRLNQNKLKSAMIIQIHDELLFEVEKSEIEIVKEIIKDCMENTIKLEVPLIVNISIGNNWMELK